MATTGLHTQSSRIPCYRFSRWTLFVVVLAAGPTIALSVRYCLQAGSQQETAVTILEVGGAREYGANLQHLKQPNNLHLGRDRLTDGELERLLGMTGLGTLHLHSPQVTDADLKYLQEMSNLHTLHICGTGVTDAGLAHLGGLTNLHTLHLCGNRITDAGLEHLKVLTNLEKLCVVGTNVTREGVSSLQDALPNHLKVHCDFEDRPASQYRMSAFGKACWSRRMPLSLTRVPLSQSRLSRARLAR